MIEPKFDHNENIALFFTTLLNSKRDLLLQYLVSDIDDILLKSEVYVPIKDGLIDIEYINNFITAIKKIIIKDLVNSNNSIISITKDIVKK
ncbi:hypothetical protein JIY74_29400 [Vibrio harveyi]|nr:hypothetical protein [Vibrio harveyi]